MNQFKDRRLRALLLCYGVVLLYLLYLHRLPGRAFAGRVNLVPGQTLRTYGRAAWFGLQAHRPALRKFWRFFGVLAGSVALVEVLQWVTGLGACDIDDWLINLPGGLGGFALWRRFFGKTSV